MSQFFKDYLWRQGKPYGVASPTHVNNDISYKIIADPYYKRISIEKYCNEVFERVIYDSAIFDFRHLKPAEQQAWQKITISDEPSKAVCHIRNHDDRLILVEEYDFKQDLCCGCRSFSPHGVAVSSQKIYYTAFNDPFNGSILYDSNQHPVMYKTYRIDEKTQEFSELIHEEWDMSQPLPTP